MRGIVRPYATAAFSYAYGKNALTRDKDLLGEWSKSLATLAAATAAIVEQTQDRALVADADLADAVCELTGEKDEARVNFLRILADNQRLRLLPEIVEMFEELKRDNAGIVTVRVECAMPPDKKTQKTLEDIMAKWTGAKVEARFEDNPALLGGVRAYARDDVLDASIRGRINNMASSLGVKAPAAE